MKRLLFFILLMPIGYKLYAQTDPVRAATIVNFTKLAEGVYHAHDAAQMTFQSGHVLLKREVQGTADFQQQFNDYLDKFHDVVTMAASMYGIYAETNRTLKRIKSLQQVATDHPSNVVAVLFSARKNDVFLDLNAAALDISRDLKMIFNSNVKMTHKEQFLLVQSLRPKIKTVNNRLLKTELAIRYTSLADLYREISYKQKNTHTRKEIAEQSIKNWKANVKSK